MNRSVDTYILVRRILSDMVGEKRSYEHGTWEYEDLYDYLLKLRKAMKASRPSTVVGRADAMHSDEPFRDVEGNCQPWHG